MNQPVSMPGACGPDGHCLTCGKLGDTGGCQDCRRSTTYFTPIVTIIPNETKTEISASTVTVVPATFVSTAPGCHHGRPTWTMCPHCLGF
jgi:hypothetical protein